MPKAQFYSYKRRLPHWRLLGATYFVTWRLASGQSDLVPEERTAVASALHHFDVQRYDLLAWVVMNDHVHVLVAARPDHRLQDILHSWKSFTAHAFARNGRQGAVWQDEYFDRVVRNEAEFVEKTQYMLNNPWKRWPELEEYPWVWAIGMGE
ncbi:MAG TPA: transposase [Candidatus Acidoferrales bacterium]|nr:transposase [Candidatus Acidoferrales bacterium]